MESKYTEVKIILKDFLKTHIVSPPINSLRIPKIEKLPSYFNNETYNFFSYVWQLHPEVETVSLSFFMSNRGDVYAIEDWFVRELKSLVRVDLDDSEFEKRMKVAIGDHNES